MNIWLKRFKSKIVTFEISKNAMYRLNPLIVNVVEDNKNYTIVNLDIITKNSLIDLACLVDEINHDRSMRYYGKLRYYYQDKEKSSSLLKKIILIEIKCGDEGRDIPEENIVLKIYYEN